MNCYPHANKNKIVSNKIQGFVKIDFLNLIYVLWANCIQKLSLFYFLIIISSSSFISAQDYNFCGVFPAHEASTSSPDSIIFDRFGNSYDLDYFQVSGGQRSICGYFDLEFHGIDDSLRNTICEVFEDLSDLIEMRENLAPCNEYAISGNLFIYVAYDISLNYPVLATGSPLYTPLDVNAPCDEVEPNRANAKINGGKSFYPIKYDGALYINPNDTFENNLDKLIWHTDINTSPSVGEFDLYSVIIHEALHILAFESRILSDGEGDKGYYSLWDNIINITDVYSENNSNAEYHKLLISDCTHNCWVINDTIFSEVEDFTNAFQNNCSVSGGIDFVIDEGIAPLVGGAITPNNLSHLADSCNSEYENYVMQAGIKRGAQSERRNITTAEKDILCLLGYKLDNCNGCYLISSKENVQSTQIDYYNTCCNPVFTGCVGDTLVIKYSDLLCNDFSNGSQIEISSYSSLNSNISVIQNDTAFLIYSDIQDVYAINYTIKGCDCRLLTSVFGVYINPCVDCSQIDPCVNLVCTNGFEEFSPNVSQVGLVVELVNGSYWVHDGSQENSPDMCNHNNNSYLRIVSSVGNPEGIACKLIKSVLPGCILKINFDASHGSTGKGYLNIHGSKTPPCSFLDSRISNDCIPRDCGNYIYSPVCIDTINVNSGATGSQTCPFQSNLEPVSEIHWVNSSGDSINYIIISTAIPEVGSKTVFIDNIVVTSSCAKSCFSYNYVEDCNEVQFVPCIDEVDISHLWNFGDSDTSTLDSPNHIYNSVDTFSVTHVVIDGCQNQDTTSLIVIVNGQGTSCCPDTTIGSTTTWDSMNLPHQGRFHTITVEKGVAFNIYDDVELQFCEGGALIIEAGAYVDLEGDLTSYGDMTWKGVFVSGDSILSQSKDFGSAGFHGLQQGFLQTRAGASIKNAEIAIRNYGKVGSSSSGGMIRCVETLFENNTIGVDFIEYQNYNELNNQPLPSLGSFIGCRFYTNVDYNLQYPFYAFAQLSKIDGASFTACKFVNLLLPDLPSQIKDFGFGIHALDAEFKVQPIISTGGIGPCPSPCTMTDSTLFSGLGHGVYVMTELQYRPYSVYNTLFENSFRGVTDLTQGGGTILFNTFNLGEVPDQDFSYGQIGAEFHFAHDGFTIQENLFVVEDEESEIIPIGVLCNGLGEFDNEIRRNTFNGVEIANQVFNVNRDNNIFLPRGLIYLCNTFEQTPSQGYDFHIPNTPDDDLIHPFQTSGSINGSNVSAGNHFAYSALDFTNYGEGGINYLFYPPGQNEEPRDSFSFGIGKFEADSNLCTIEYCAPPCLEDIEDLKEDFLNHLDTYETELDNYLDAISSENQFKIDSARSRALYYQRLSSSDAYTVLQHLMIDTLEYNTDSLITWMGYFDTYGAEIMIAGEYASRNDFKTALDVLETVISRRDLSTAQFIDLAYLIDIYALLKEAPLYSFTAIHRSILRNIAYQNTGIASGVSRALLSSFKEYIPLPYYHGNQIGFRNTIPDSSSTSFFIVNQPPLKIYPNPSDGDVTIDWQEPELTCTSLTVYNLLGQKILELIGDYKSPIRISTQGWTSGIHWITVLDNTGKLHSGKVLIFRK